MTERIVLFGVALLLNIAFWCSAYTHAASPNLVFIMADDLGWADVGFHGGSAPTPHLDRLARESLEFTQHYVAPVCSPTRTGFLTGRYWSRFGITTPTNERALPWDTVTLPRALKSCGYKSCLVGKWHLGSRPEWGPNHYGFDHSYGSLAGGVTSWSHRYKKGPFSVTWHRNEELLEEQGHVTDLLTREAVQWIADRDDQPFFLYVPFTAVHLPINEPKEWLARVPDTINTQIGRQYAACIMHWMPTFCAVAGREQDKNLEWDGVDLSSRLMSGTPLAPRTIYIAGSRWRQVSLRSGDWKLVTDTKSKHELFHLAKDPFEEHDLADEQSSKLEAMLAKLNVAQQRDNDSVAK